MSPSNALVKAYLSCTWQTARGAFVLDALDHSLFGDGCLAALNNQLLNTLARIDNVVASKVGGGAAIDLSNSIMNVEENKREKSGVGAHCGDALSCTW